MTHRTESGSKQAIQQRLVEYRNRAGLSQQGLADFIGIQKDRYSKWENRSTIPAEFIPPVCARLGITAWFLLTGDLVEGHMTRRGDIRPNRRGKRV
jgi:transcriptional regulator with XRE-family HTH domain